VAEAGQQGLGPVQLLAAVPLLVPSTLPYTIPATTLFATCVVFGRLAHDNEILAIKAAGIHLRKVVGPAALLGVLMSATTMGLYYHLIPYTHYLLRSNFLNDAEEFLYMMLKKDRFIKMPNLPYSIFVTGVQGRRLEGALFKRRETKGSSFDVIARAREAELRVDLPHKQVEVHMRHCYILDDKQQNRGYFQDKIWEVPLPANFGAPKEARPRGMNYQDLLERRLELLDKLKDKNAEVELAKSGLTTAASPHFAQHVADLRNQEREVISQIHNVEAELHMRPALSLGCLCFVLIGCPVGIWFSRSDYLSAFITCFLPIVFVYYPLLLCGTSYAKQGKLDPAIGLWAANALMAVIAVGLFRRLLKH
jgi:lipopolysaccharide export system permease protein